MNLIIQNTLDGSKTLFSTKYNQHYHNINGAYTETMHIYIELGLKKFNNQKVNILEIGYGTGLNSIITYYENLKLNNEIFYHGIDINTINLELAKQLNYFSFLGLETHFNSNFYEKWNETVKISENFKLFKENISLEEIIFKENYNLVYFDAFSPDCQAEMWTNKIFKKIFDAMLPNSYLLTYSSKGVVKQALKESGFKIQRFKGPLGKRHIIGATKI